MMPVFQYETLTLNVIMQQQLHQQVKPVMQFINSHVTQIQQFANLQHHKSSFHFRDEPIQLFSLDNAFVPCLI